VGKVVMYASVSVDGFIADENDQPGPLFDWLLSGDVPLDDSGVLKVSQTRPDVHGRRTRLRPGPPAREKQQSIMDENVRLIASRRLVPDCLLPDCRGSLEASGSHHVRQSANRGGRVATRR
jgi:hypothetical protein